MTWYFILVYLFSLYLKHADYEEHGVLDIGDILMFILAPLSIPCVVVVKIVSSLVSLETVVLKKDNNT